MRAEERKEGPAFDPGLSEFEKSKRRLELSILENSLAVRVLRSMLPLRSELFRPNQKANKENEKHKCQSHPHLCHRSRGKQTNLLHRLLPVHFRVPFPETGHVLGDVGRPGRGLAFFAFAG